MAPHYTGAGDDGTTGLLYGGRVAKDSVLPTAYGDVDEAQAFIGLARTEFAAGGEVDDLLVHVARDLWVLMAELATAPENRHKLTPGQGAVTVDMVQGLESRIGELETRFEVPREFVVPGQTRAAGVLDVARTVVRRAERHALAAAGDGSHVVPYLNRLSSLLWSMARWVDGDSTLRTKDVS
ncbi:MAG TPA: cob(I)yrinic acid a,c-diamide adenosyltransferase [Acidimicrobiales bacterium]|nr:cob(I)yrinic acid a,c-diamide adenosyltransferase [Acidimicrobiales bacterium]